MNADTHRKALDFVKQAQGLLEIIKDTRTDELSTRDVSLLVYQLGSAVADLALAVTTLIENDATPPPSLPCFACRKRVATDTMTYTWILPNHTMTALPMCALCLRRSVQTDLSQFPYLQTLRDIQRDVIASQPVANGDGS